MRRLVLAILLFTLCQFSYANTKIEYGIISAMPVEAKPILQLMQHKKAHDIYHIHYMTGTIAGKSVVVTTSGMGRIAAGAIIALLLQNFNPKRLVFVGAAGSLQPSVKMGDVVISKDIYNAEHYVFPAGKKPTYLSLNTHAINPALLTADAQLLALAKQIKAPFAIHFGTIVSSDKFPSPQSLLLNLSKHGYLAIESEGVALAQVAGFFHKPWLVIRGISNPAAYFSPKNKAKVVHELKVDELNLACNHATTVLYRLLQVK